MGFAQANGRAERGAVGVAILSLQNQKLAKKGLKMMELSAGKTIRI